MGTDTPYSGPKYESGPVSQEIQSGRIGSASGILNTWSIADPIRPRINFTSGFDPLLRKRSVFGASIPSKKITSCQDNV